MNKNTLIEKTTDTIAVYEKNDFSFDIYFANNIFQTSQLIKEICEDNKCLVIISETIEKYYYSEIENYFNNNFENKYKIIVIPTTEQNKTMETVLEICKAGKNFGLDRRSLMIGIGGGILLDIVGFAATMFKRKLKYLRIPTTLVGQIDAGVGIKTGINFEGAKNYIGSFYPPVATIIDNNFLKTLPEEHFLCGLAEILKMGIIMDNDLFCRIQDNYKSLIQNRYQLDPMLSKEINYKAVDDMLSELQGNFFEYNLERYVDFGHTFSPFIEEHSNYSINHGIAVAMDIAISTEISFLLDMISNEHRSRIHNLLLDIGYDIYDAQTYLFEKMWKSLDNVILHRGNNLNLVVPTEIGKATFLKERSDISDTLLQTAILSLKEYQERHREMAYA
ncbi:sedoheptulose 7-phosphate cyclase [Paenibacillus sp. GSMTC-2017]|uniref:sedoheptulose 7-phosphate cyclase n=1 Tax=Paenibacillus sp. GSMTC-2017 TaxID=2794350 RepID=UPI0018D8B50B|nr:sedoheptulose 7-phosphate cyclase [Paenibacillus sp. GSMTC-2017]MBH5320322.1 sedoheptulose 7-phosphate cyclase [Paenibacillus sp. GSMTC-2017]